MSIYKIILIVLTSLICFSCKTKKANEQRTSAVNAETPKASQANPQTSPFDEETGSYQVIPADEVAAFQKNVRESGEFFQASRLAEYYHIEPIIDLQPVWETSMVDLGGGKHKGIVIETIKDDDSVAAVKVVVFAQPTQYGWQINEIRKSIKCVAGHGQQTWEKELCK